MVAQIVTGSLWGVDAYRVDVEVGVSRGLPNVFIIGLPDGAVREARLRIESALRAIGRELPSGKRITINLAPGDRRKVGCSYDLPMAVGLLAATGVVPAEPAQRFAYAGELALDGRLRPIRGALALARLAREIGLHGLVVPEDNVAEAALIPGLPVYGARTLDQVIAHLEGFEALTSAPATSPELVIEDAGIDLQDVRGQIMPKRALEIAAAGGHHLLFLGPPGTGKTMLARRLPGLLPPLDFDEALEVTKIYSAAGLLGGPLVRSRPFRAPHHTASEAALVGGGGGVVRVGELSLAHLGVLFLDEVAEYPRNVLDALRQPLERGSVEISRADYRVCLPAQTLLVVALNPCPCGWDWAGAPRECSCAPGAAERYVNRLSGPLLDRIDMQVAVDPVSIEALSGEPDGATTAEVRVRVAQARQRQRARFGETERLRLNAWMTPADTRRHCSLDPTGRRMLHDGVRNMGLSARAVDRVLRVARTAADLAGRGRISAADVAEALNFRRIERGLTAGTAPGSASKAPRQLASIRRARPLLGSA